MKSLLPAVPLLLWLALTPAEAQSLGVPITDPATTVAAAVAAGLTPPPPCSGTPLPDTLNGSVGSSGCFIPMDSTRPTAVQAQNTTLAADCSWSVAFARPFTSSSPIVHASVVLPAGATQPISCAPITRTTTSASGKCFQNTTSTLAAVTVVGVSVAVGSQTINPTATTCTAGMPVMVVGREPTG